MRNLLVTAAIAAATLSSHAKPNIVFLLADDCTRFDLGAYGSKDSKTPTIDRLAAQGMRFTRASQAAPICSPTRHNLYTGMYPTRTGAYPNHTFAREGTLSVVQRMKPLGYRVALSGKRHIGPESVFPFEYLDNDTGDGEGPGPDFRAIDKFMGDAAGKKQSFALFICSHLPHSPWTEGDRSLFDANTLKLPPNFVDNAATRANYRNYLAEINALDGQLKQALNLLDKYGLSDSTVVFFASEQGTSQPFAKWTCYNAGLGTGIIVRWPGHIQAGSVSNALVEYADVVPTFMDIAGGQAPAGLDGTSFLPVLLGKTNAHKEYGYGMMTTRGIFGGSDYFPIREVSDANYRLIANIAPNVEFHCQSEMPDWETAAATDPKAARLVDRFRHRPAYELYDDTHDQWNQTNLIDNPRYDSVRVRLQARLEAWMRYADDDPMRTELTAWEHMDREPFNGDSVVVIEAAAPGHELKNKTAGLAYAVYPGAGTSIPDFAGLTPAKTGVTPDMDGAAGLPGRGDGNYVVRYTGFVKAAQNAYHTFYMTSSGPARITIDGKRVVEYGRKAPANDFPRRYGSILLDSGWHAIEAVFLGDNVKDGFAVGWSYPGLIAAQGDLGVPAAALAQGDAVVSIPSLSDKAAAPAWRIEGNTLVTLPGLGTGEVRLRDGLGRQAARVAAGARFDLASLPHGLYILEAWSQGRRLCATTVARH